MTCVQFDRYSEDGKTISEKDFGNILLTYAGLPSKKMARMLKRVKRKFKEEPQVVQHFSFFQLLTVYFDSVKAEI